jgi:hypothetical protein
MRKISKRRRVSQRPPSGRALRRAFEQRWRELSGDRFSLRRRVPESFMLGLATLQPGAARLRRRGGADPNIVVTVRRRQGTDCEQQAEIAGFYSKQLNGAACIGRAAVLAKLNAAAQDLCCKTLKCPARCPCVYQPRQQLAIYRCNAQVEEGFLLQGQRVWNCACVEAIG